MRGQVEQQQEVDVEELISQLQDHKETPSLEAGLEEVTCLCVWDLFSWDPLSSYLLKTWTGTVWKVLDD